MYSGSSANKADGHDIAEIVLFKHNDSNSYDVHGVPFWLVRIRFLWSLRTYKIETQTIKI